MDKKTGNKGSKKFLNEIEEQLRNKYEKVKKVGEVYHDQLHKRLPQDSKEAMDIKQGQDLAASIEDLEQNEMILIEQALKRISDGTYGICLDCEKPIPVERLKAIPYSEYCVACKTKKEEE